jgi:hypothetical protein
VVQVVVDNLVELVESLVFQLELVVGVEAKFVVEVDNHLMALVELVVVVGVGVVVQVVVDNYLVVLQALALAFVEVVVVVELVQLELDCMFLVQLVVAMEQLELVVVVEVGAFVLVVADNFLVEEAYLVVVVVEEVEGQILVVQLEQQVL